MSEDGWKAMHANPTKADILPGWNLLYKFTQVFIVFFYHVIFAISLI